MIRIAMVMLLAMAAVSPSLAFQQCSAEFPSVLQSHSGGKLTLAAGASILGETDNTLEFVSKQFDNFYRNEHCDGAECQISGTSTQPVPFASFSDPNDFPSQASFSTQSTSRTFSCSSGSDSLSKKRYANVVISGRCELDIDDAEYIGNLYIYDGGRLYLDEDQDVYINNLIVNTTWSGGGIFAEEDVHLHINDLDVRGQPIIYASDSGDTFTVTGYGDWYFASTAYAQFELTNNPLNSFRIDADADVHLGRHLNSKVLILTERADLSLFGGGEINAISMQLFDTAEIVNDYENSSTPINTTVFGDLQLSNQYNDDLLFQPHYIDSITFGNHVRDSHWQAGLYQINQVNGLGTNSHNLIAHGVVEWQVDSGVRVYNGVDFTGSDSNSFWRLYSSGDVSFENYSTYYGLVHAAGDFSASNDTELKGMFAAANVTLNGQAEVTRADEVVPQRFVIPCPTPVCPVGESLQHGLRFSTYDTFNEYGIADNARQMQTLIDTYVTGRSPLGYSFTDQLYHREASNINPHFSTTPHDNYVSVFAGYLKIDNAGFYNIAVDGNNAVEVLVDGVVRSGFYYLYGMRNSPQDTNSIYLSEGYHSIEYRHQEWEVTEGYALYLGQGRLDNDDIVAPELLYSCQPNPHTPVFEYGELTLDGNGRATITFNQPFTEPPIVITTVGIDFSNGATFPEAVRVKDVSTQQATFELVTPPANALQSRTMTIPFLAMEPGQLALQNSNGQSLVTLEAGRVNTKAHIGTASNDDAEGSYQPISFDNGNFQGAPALLMQRQAKSGTNDGLFLPAFANSVTANGANLAFDTGEVWLPNNRISVDEIGWIAVQGSGVVDINGEFKRVASGLSYNITSETALSPQAQCNQRFNYTVAFDQAPLLWGTKNTRNGGNGGWTRVCLNEASRHSFVIDEDISGDSERNHLDEDIAYLAIQKPTLDQLYYRISHGGQGVTCRGTPVRVQACQDEDCTIPALDGTKVTMTPSTGWVPSETLTINGGEATVELWSGNSGSVLVGLVPDGAGDTSCWVNGSKVSDMSQCLVNYSDSALLLTPGAPLGCRSETITIEAVQASQSDPLVCAAGVDGSRAIEFVLSPQSPSALNGAQFSLGGSTLPANSMETRTLSFSDGQATLPYSFDNVGQLKLTATYRDTQGGQSIEFDGDTTFTVAPAGFHIDSGDNNALCASGDGSCSAFTAAGADFNLRVTAACYQSANDSDFSDNTIASNFVGTVTAQPTMVAPDSSQWPDGSGGSVSVPIASAGVGTATAKAAEVGVFQWHLSADVSYLGRTISKSQHSAAKLGRFTPAYLEVIANEPLLSGCNAMAYLAEPRPFGTLPELQVVGRNAQGGETRNYNAQGFWKLDAGLARSYRDHDGNAPTVSTVNAGSVAALDANDPSAARTLQLQGVELAYQRDQTLIAPFDAQLRLDFGIAALTDSDGICYRNSVNGACQPLTQAASDGPSMRYGRLALTSVYGNDDQQLALPLTAQFYDGTAFVTHSSDNLCTQYQSALLSLADNLGADRSDLLVLTPITGLQMGEGALPVMAPGAPLVLDAIYDLSASPWLQWYWDGNNLGDPRAKLTFGRYRGNDRVIYRREIR